MTDPRPATPASGAPVAVDGQWHRVHPVSPLVRGWLALVALLVIVGQNFVDDIVEMVRSGQGPDDIGALGIVGAIVGGIFLLILLGFYLSWRFTRYRLGSEMVQLQSGVIFRQRRHVRLDRVQAVDLRQPLLARLGGLAELKFEAADAGESAVSLAFLKMAEARVLRQEIMRRASGIQSGQDPDDAAAAGSAQAPDTLSAGAQGGDSRGSVPEAVGPDASGTDAAGQSARHGAVAGSAPPDDQEPEEQVMLQVPPGRIVGSTFIGSGLITTAVVLLVIFLLARWGLTLWLPQDTVQGILDELFAAASIPVILGLVVGFGSTIWSSINRGWNFTVSTSRDGLVLRYGLLDTNSQTVPPGRIQAIKVDRPLVWRPFGWYRMSVSVAGYGAEVDPSGGKSRVLPVGSFEDVLRVLTVVAPEPGTGADEDVQQVILAGIDGSGPDHGFTLIPRRVRVLDPLVWRRHGFRSTETMLLIRSGRLGRALVLQPHERIQSLRLSQGPLERYLGVADVQLHTPPGPVQAGLHHLDVEVAEELAAAERRIAATARRMRDRNHWMRPEELARFNQRTREAADDLGQPAPAAVTSTLTPTDPAPPASSAAPPPATDRIEAPPPPVYPPSTPARDPLRGPSNG